MAWLPMTLSNFEGHFLFETYVISTCITHKYSAFKLPCVHVKVIRWLQAFLNGMFRCCKTSILKSASRGPSAIAEPPVENGCRSSTIENTVEDISDKAILSKSYTSLRRSLRNESHCSLGAYTPSALVNHNKTTSIGHKCRRKSKLPKACQRPHGTVQRTHAVPLPRWHPCHILALHITILIWRSHRFSIAVF